MFTNFWGRTLHPQWKLKQSALNSQLLDFESIGKICPSWDPDFELLPSYVFKREDSELTPVLSVVLKDLDGVVLLPANWQKLKWKGLSSSTGAATEVIINF